MIIAIITETIPAFPTYFLSPFSSLAPKRCAIGSEDVYKRQGITLTCEGENPQSINYEYKCRDAKVDGATAVSAVCLLYTSRCV